MWSNILSNVKLHCKKQSVGYNALFKPAANCAILAGETPVRRAKSARGIQNRSNISGRINQPRQQHRVIHKSMASIRLEVC